MSDTCRIYFVYVMFNKCTKCLWALLPEIVLLFTTTVSEETINLISYVQSSACKIFTSVEGQWIKLSSIVYWNLSAMRVDCNFQYENDQVWLLQCGMYVGYICSNAVLYYKFKELNLLVIWMNISNPYTTFQSEMFYIVLGNICPTAIVSA